MFTKDFVALGATQKAAESAAPSAIYNRAACALEWNDTDTWGHLPSGGGWHTYSLPYSSKQRHFVWRRVATNGTGNGGFWVPAKPLTEAAKALLEWVRAQTTFCFYGGYWWELVDRFGFEAANEMAESVRRAKDNHVPYPNSCGAASRIDPRLGELSGPRMWAFVNAVTGTSPWPGDNRRARATECRAARINRIRRKAEEQGMRFIPEI